MEFVGKRGEGIIQSYSTPLLDDSVWRAGEMRKRVPGMEFVGKRALGKEFVGKRAPGMEFVGK